MLSAICNTECTETFAIGSQGLTLFDNSDCFNFPEVSFSKEELDLSMDFTFPQQIKQDLEMDQENDFLFTKEEFEFFGENDSVPESTQDSVKLSDVPSITRADSFEPELGIKKSISKKKKKPVRKDSIFSISSLDSFESGDIKFKPKSKLSEVCYTGLEASKASKKYRFIKHLRETRKKLSNFPLCYEVKFTKLSPFAEEETEEEDDEDILLDLVDSEDEDNFEDDQCHPMEVKGVNFNNLVDCIKRSKIVNASGAAQCLKTFRRVKLLVKESESEEE